MSFSLPKYSISFKGFQIQAAEAGAGWAAHLAMTLLADFRDQLNGCA